MVQVSQSLYVAFGHQNGSTLCWINLYGYKSGQNVDSYQFVILSSRVLENRLYMVNLNSVDQNIAMTSLTKSKISMGGVGEGAGLNKETGN